MNQANSTAQNTLGRNRTIELLRKLELVSKGGTSIYAPPETGDDSLLPAVAVNLPEELKQVTSKSTTGFVLFLNHGPGFMQTTLVLPPFPVKNIIVNDYIDIKPLESLIGNDYFIGIILIRMGAFAVGIAHGETIISSKISGGCIHGRHRQGGSSAARFARHREKQIELFFTRACGYTREHIEPHTRKMDYIIYGGARTTINTFKKQCSLLAKIPAPQLAPYLDIAQPRQQVLEETVVRLYSSRVIQWRQDNAH